MDKFRRFKPRQNKHQHLVPDAGSKLTSIHQILEPIFIRKHLESQSIISEVSLDNLISVSEGIRNQYPLRPLCLISSWCIWELVDNSYPSPKVMSHYLTSNFVIKDDLEEVQFGGSIMSDEIVNVENDYIAHTASRIFILVGKGFRNKGLY